MKKIIFGITSLTLGGAERVLVDIANELSNKYEIEIFTIYAKGELEKQLKENIKITSLYKVSYSELSKLQKMLVPIKILCNKTKIYKRYILKSSSDIEVSFLEGAITRIFSTQIAEKSKVSKIAWVHNDISKVFGTSLKAKMKKAIDRNIYSKYDKLIFVSRDNLENFNKYSSKYEKLKEVEKKLIYNYIDADRVKEKAEDKIEDVFEEDSINFLTVARLVEQKGIDRLAAVHKKLIDSKVFHKFYIIGDGPEKERIQKLIKEYNIQNTFKLLGAKENPYPYIKKADYFCLLSKFEGYGMVLEEAKILDKDIIITNTAAIEAVKDYDKSIIVDNDENGIYDGLLKTIENYDKSKVKEIEKETYNNRNILEKIEEILEGKIEN